MFILVDPVHFCTNYSLSLIALLLLLHAVRKPTAAAHMVVKQAGAGAGPVPSGFAASNRTGPASAVQPEAHNKPLLGAAKLRQHPASVLSLSAKLIAHIGSFCDKATCRAAAEAHNCFMPIHQSSAEHTWDGTGNTTTAAWFGRDEDRSPQHDTLRWRHQLLPLAERF